MAQKPEFVDTIGEATRQRWRRSQPAAGKKAAPEERSKLSHWPPKSWLEWRIETFTPWRLKAWNNRFWGS